MNRSLPLPPAAKFKIKARHAASAVAIGASLYFSASEFHNQKIREQRDLEASSALLADGLRAAIEPRLGAGSMEELKGLAERFGRRGKLAGIAVYDPQGRIIAATAALAPRLSAEPAAVLASLSHGGGEGDYEKLGGAVMRVTALPLRRENAPDGALAVFYDTKFIETRLDNRRWDNARRLAIQAALFLAAVWVFGLFFK